MERRVVGVEAGPPRFSICLGPIVAGRVHTVLHAAVPAGTCAVVGFTFVRVGEDVVGGYDQPVPLHLYCTGEAVDISISMLVTTSVWMIYFHERVEAVFRVLVPRRNMEDLIR